jgi:hypothetical protein
LTISKWVFVDFGCLVVKGEGAQKGLVQLWFDLRVVLDVFSHRKIRNGDLRKILNEGGGFLRVPGSKEPTTVTKGEDDMTELMLWTKMTEVPFSLSSSA